MIVQQKLLEECVESDLARFVLKGEDAEDWERWHNQITRIVALKHAVAIVFID